MSRLQLDEHEYDACASESLLDSLLRQGAGIAYSCRKGSCHCCACRLVEGEVEPIDLTRPNRIDEHHILPCVSRPLGDVRLAAPDPVQRPVPAELVGRRRLSEDQFEIELAPSQEWRYRAGQLIYLIRRDGLVRPYSLASLDGESYTLTVHVRRLAGGAMSEWLAATPVGTRMSIRGPHGAGYRRDTMANRPLLLLATGIGAGALLAVARDALSQGHGAPVSLVVGVRNAVDARVIAATARAMAAAHPNFQFALHASQDAGVGAIPGRILPAAFSRAPWDFSSSELFLCGSPAMVAEARWRALAAGVHRLRIHADPFVSAHPRAPQSAQIVGGIQADPELWAALENGPGLTRVLQRFYARVYADSRLSHFFHGVSLDRAVQKQYEFLADLFSGTRTYFGLNAFNAHHWMVISDDLFDYREALFESVLHESAIPPHLIARWMAVHERFRGEIVKEAPRGLVVDGVEQAVRTHTVEQIEIDSVCDNCGGEIRRGESVRYQYRTGRLHCRACARL